MWMRTRTKEETDAEDERLLESVNRIVAMSTWRFWRWRRPAHTPPKL